VWIRLETDWQHDPFVQALDAHTRLVLLTIWCIAAARGEVILDANGEPAHAVLDLEFLDPAFISRESGVPVDLATKAIETLSKPLPPPSLWTNEIPARLTIDQVACTATVRNVGKFQSQAFKDRERKRRVRAVDRTSLERPRPSEDVSRNDDDTSTSTEQHEPSAPGFRDFVSAFDAGFKLRTGSKPEWGKKQGGMVKTLLSKHRLEECLKRLRVFFGPGRPKYLTSFDLGTFVANFDKFVGDAGPVVALNPNKYREVRR